MDGKLEPLVTAQERAMLMDQRFEDRRKNRQVEWGDLEKRSYVDRRKASVSSDNDSH